MYMARTTNVVAMATPHTTARTITTVVESVDDDDDVVVVPSPLELPDDAPVQLHLFGHEVQNDPHDRAAHVAGSGGGSMQATGVGAGVGEVHPHLAGHELTKPAHDKLAQEAGSGTPLHNAGLGEAGATVVG